jgi:radical SAM superfamily enzyme YgiQ (UPF0313 family)
MVPIPGTRLYNEGKEKGWFKESDIDYYAGSLQPVMIPPGTTKEEIASLVQDAYKGFYLRRDYMVKIAKSIRSFDDVERIARGFYSIVKRFGV